MAEREGEAVPESDENEVEEGEGEGEENGDEGRPQVEGQERDTADVEAGMKKLEVNGDGPAHDDEGTDEDEDAAGETKGLTDEQLKRQAEMLAEWLDKELGAFRLPMGL